MNQAIEDFVSKKRIAVVGFSKSGRKFGNSAYKELSQRGYEVYAVHPSGEEISGVKCFPDLTGLKDKIDGVFISVSKNQVVPILKEANSIGLKNIWLQQGSESDEALNTVKDLKLNVVSKKCILMYAEPVNSIHKFHRSIAKIFGSY